MGALVTPLHGDHDLQVFQYFRQHFSNLFSPKPLKIEPRNLDSRCKDFILEDYQLKSDNFYNIEQFLIALPESIF